VIAVRMLRPLLALAAIVGLAAGCTASISGTGRPDAAASRSVAPTPAPAPTHNGVAGMSGEQALGAAYDALRRARTARMRADFGKGADRWSIDVRYRGADSDGTLVIDGMTVRVRKVGRWVYRKAGDAFWRPRVGPAGALRLRGRWLRVPLGDRSLADLGDFLQQDKLAELALGVPGTLSTGVFRTVNGVETVPVVSDGAERETVYVAIVGEPYPIRITTGTGVGTIDFLDYGKPVTVRAPARGEFVDLDALPLG